MQPAEHIAGWSVGPPAPKALSFTTRGLQAASLLIMLIWVFGYLGGVGVTPTALPPDPQTGTVNNDTSKIFNWHPLCMTLAFVVVMGEALLAYKVPLLAVKDRQRSKAYHAALQTAAVVLASLGLVAAFQSHNLKRPDPLPNMYSVHSWLGLSVFSLMVLQYAVGFSAYLVPQWHQSHRAALGPVHAFLGMAVFVGGAAAMAAGIQEKTTFVQLLAKPATVYSGAMRAPAVLVVLVLLTAAAVLYHLAPTAAERQRRQQQADNGAAASLAATPYEPEPLHVSHRS